MKFIRQSVTEPQFLWFLLVTPNKSGDIPMSQKSTAHSLLSHYYLISLLAALGWPLTQCSNYNHYTWLWTATT